MRPPSSLRDSVGILSVVLLHWLLPSQVIRILEAEQLGKQLGQLRPSFEIVVVAGVRRPLLGSGNVHSPWQTFALMSSWSRLQLVPLPPSWQVERPGVSERWWALPGQGSEVEQRG